MLNKLWNTILDKNTKYHKNKIEGKIAITDDDASLNSVVRSTSTTYGNPPVFLKMRTSSSSFITKHEVESGRRKRKPHQLDYATCNLLAIVRNSSSVLSTKHYLH